LSDHDVLTHAREGLGKHLPLQAEGYKCTTDDLLNVLLGVAANRGTLESVCSDLVGTPDAATIRNYFNEQLCVEDLPDLARRMNAAMADEIPPRVWQQVCDVALDFQDRPYYGKAPQATGLWVRGRARDGTTRFYRVATAYVMLKHLRVTLALRFVLPEDETVTIVQDLQKALKSIWIAKASRRKSPVRSGARPAARARCVRGTRAIGRRIPSRAPRTRPSRPSWRSVACSPPPSAPSG
jgi:putative transposase